MATIIFPFVAVDGNGHVRANAKLYFYETGTTTPQATYSDSALSVTNTNPVVADSNGLFTGIYLGDQPDFEAYKAILKDSADVTIWTQDPIAGAPLTTPVSAALLRGYISGIQRTANTTTTLTLGAGICTDDTNTVMLSLVAGTINCATVGADGLDTGSLAVSTSYHVFAIGKSDGTTARLVSTSVSSPTMPSGYVYKRRISSFKTNASSQIINYSQVGDDFFLSAAISTFNGAPTVSAPATITLAIPTGLTSFGKFRANGAAGATSSVLFHSPVTPGGPPATPAGNMSLQGAGTWGAAGEFEILTDTTAQITASIQTGTVTLGVVTIGWIDTRGKDG